MLQIKPVWILPNTELIFSYNPHSSTFVFIYMCLYMGLKEKECKREEDTGSGLSSSAPSACLKLNPTLICETSEIIKVS